MTYELILVKNELMGNEYLVTQKDNEKVARIAFEKRLECLCYNSAAGGVSESFRGEDISILIQTPPYNSSVNENYRYYKCSKNDKCSILKGNILQVSVILLKDNNISYT